MRKNNIYSYIASIAISFHSLCPFHSLNFPICLSSHKDPLEKKKTGPLRHIWRLIF